VPQTAKGRGRLNRGDEDLACGQGSRGVEAGGGQIPFAVISHGPEGTDYGTHWEGVLWGRVQRVSPSLPPFCTLPHSLLFHTPLPPLSHSLPFHFHPPHRLAPSLHTLPRLFPVPLGASAAPALHLHCTCIAPALHLHCAYISSHTLSLPIARGPCSMPPRHLPWKAPAQCPFLLHPCLLYGRCRHPSYSDSLPVCFV